MKLLIFTNFIQSLRLVMIIVSTIALSACISDPELYSEQDPLQVQTKDLNDIDLDGVINERDLCASTPDDAIIDNNGCPKLTGRPKVKFRIINFGFDKSNLSNYEYDRVLKMANFLHKYPETTLYLIGDTSMEGSDAYNEKLAQRRIKTVHDVLIDNNIDVKRLNDETFNVENHIPESLTGRQKRLIAVLKWPDDYKDYEIEWDIFTESKKSTRVR
ncbi:MAG TPA: hypothetical protein DIS98_04630 [Colwellia sp.]|nr:hypothetical protein [Colwellia sp.]|tara:strand:- start:141 stop:788 length:648 start_codon:yes stop_codon:yes gene_type:complete